MNAHIRFFLHSKRALQPGMDAILNAAHKIPCLIINIRFTLHVTRTLLRKLQVWRERGGMRGLGARRRRPNKNICW